MIYYKCSNGERVTDSTCKARLSKVYREMYAGEPHPYCRGCGGRANGSAHLIPKARAKQLGKTELIWFKPNILPACNSCNTILENPQSEEFRQLNCYDYVIEILKKYDYQRYVLAVDDPKNYTVKQIIKDI